MALEKNYTDISENEKYRVVIIPLDILDSVKSKLGDEFLWNYDKDTQELFLMKKPDSYTDFLAGLGEEMWKDVGGVDYLRQERESWEE